MASSTTKRKRLLVSGCFDLLHSGHVAFFETAAQLGDVYVQLGNDKNIRALKGRPPMFPEDERAYLVNSIQYVKEARVSAGFGMLDWEADLERLKPDALYVNEDGDRPTKAAICKKYGIEYIVDKRKPKTGLPPRSSTSLKKILAGATVTGSKAKVVTLQYADRRRSECIRFLLIATGTNFKNKNVQSQSQLLALTENDKNPFGKVPCLEVDDLILCDERAMVEFVAEYGPEDLTGQSAPERALLRQIHGACLSARELLAELHNGLSTRHRVCEEQVRTVNLLEKALAPRPGPFVVGGRPTYADYVICEWLLWCMDLLATEANWVRCIKRCLRVRSLFEATRSMARIVKYLKSDGRQLFRTEIALARK